MDGRSDGREEKVQQNFLSIFHPGFHLHPPSIDYRLSLFDSNVSSVQFHRESFSSHFQLWLIQCFFNLNRDCVLDGEDWRNGGVLRLHSIPSWVSVSDINGFMNIQIRWCFWAFSWVLRLEVSFFNVYITNNFQTTFALLLGGGGAVSRGDCE